YQATLDSVIINELGDGLFYQYYKIPGAVEGEVRETYFNFDYTGDNASEAERRYVVLNEDGQEIVDDVDSKTESRRMPVFRNTNPVSQHVTVTYELDLRPAYVHVAAGTTLTDIQGAFTITSVDQIDDGGVYMNGPATGGWTGWGTELANSDEKKMWDDGTHGDATAGDTIYAVQFEYAPDSSNNTIGQEFKFGISGGDNESGYGLNHIENIDDTESEATIHTQWGSINPNFYSLWDYDNAQPVAIEKEAVTPNEFKLSQNYPNPFNPTTTIEYTLPKTTNVTISVYNLVGELVNRITYNNLKAGQHDFIWHSKDMNGHSVSSGVYFYELQAGNFHSVKKMVLMK
ncbi:MAG: T9SS type A sorting domain-containing protein, partial [Candidatus Marinimicrobia bacterium]|nr:T9SS type A sorting domain-containing protein [Candidatus Neomarinimicrobiota bacterium]